MYQVLVFYLPKNLERAQQIADVHRGAVLRSAKFFQGIEEMAARVIVDDGALGILRAYKARGVDVRTFSDAEVDPDNAATVQDDDGQEVIVDPDAAKDAALLPEGYKTEKRGNWYSVVGPNGEQIGKSKHTQDEAIAGALEILSD